MANTLFSRIYTLNLHYGVWLGIAVSYLILAGLTASEQQESPGIPNPKQGNISASGKFVKAHPSSISGQNTPTPTLSVQSLGKTKLLIGGVTIDKVAGSISFPARVEVRDELLEYVLVHQTGKTHESLLSTKISPKALHVAVLLLGGEGKRPTIEVTWKKNGPDALVKLTDLIRPTKATPALSNDGWIYGGSQIDLQGRLTAQREGSFVSLLNDPDALIFHQVAASLGKDDAYKPFAKKLPGKGVIVRVLMKFPLKK